jgi:hypothetical protein
VARALQSCGNLGELNMRMQNIYTPVWRAYSEADKAWSRELQRVFGRKSGDKRYLPEGQGKPGTLLNALFLDYRAKQAAWHRECDDRRVADYVSEGLGEF